MTSALIVMLVGAMVSATSLIAPPTLPPEPAPAPAPAPEPATEVDPPPADAAPEQPPADRPAEQAPAEQAPTDPEPVRTALPPGLQPIPFPLEHQRRSAPPTSDDANAPAPAAQRRSIVDLRDPFDRPPPQPRPEGQHEPVRLLMPDLKDPFAPGVRPVRSKTLDMRVPNDIRDPFRSPPSNRPACAKTTSDGVVVQAPGQRKLPRGDCQPSQLDLRDPFAHER